MRDAIGDNAERLAARHGLEIEVVRKASFHKEDRIEQVLARRGEEPCWCTFSRRWEACPSYKPWHDKMTHQR